MVIYEAFHDNLAEALLFLSIYRKYLVCLQSAFQVNCAAIRNMAHKSVSWLDSASLSIRQNLLSHKLTVRKQVSPNAE